MSEKKKRYQELKKELLSKRRFVIQNEYSLKESFSLRLTFLNMFTTITIVIILIILFTIFFIAFTPLKEYIPGYASTKLRQQATSLTLKTDSLQKVIQQNNIYLLSIKKALRGEIEIAKLNKDSIRIDTNSNEKNKNFNITESEKKLKEVISKDDKFNLFEEAKPRVNQVFFPPTSGKIIKTFDAVKKSLGVTIALAQKTTIKSISSGVILYSNWSPTENYVVIIQHTDNIISVYKNLSSTNKNLGSFVKSSEAIGLSGDENQKFQFQLWMNGIPSNPTQFINFN